MNGIKLIVGRDSQGEGSLLINRDGESLGSGESLVELGGIESGLSILEMSESFGFGINFLHSGLNKARSGLGGLY